MNGTPIPSGYKFGSRDEPLGSVAAPDASSKKDDKKRGFWHRFGGGAAADKTAGAVARPVFGVPLAESIAISHIAEGLELPSVVYRCIEYLEKSNAANEEGIYRLSGSSAVVKALKERFNAEGDVDLLATGEQFYDPHAVAGLLKTFLRELPASVLTRELHLEFMRVNGGCECGLGRDRRLTRAADIVDRRERVNELGALVSILPLANYSLLRTLCSQ
jgi:RalA-binding protein 1